MLRQAWAVLEVERGNTDLARNLLRSASEKDPCDIYIWQVCARGLECVLVCACDVIWPVGWREEIDTYCASIELCAAGVPGR